MAGILIRRGNLDTDTNCGKMMKVSGEDHRPAKERGLEYLVLPLWPSEGACPVNTLIPDLQLP